MKKKAISVLCLVAVVLSFCACLKEGNVSDSNEVATDFEDIAEISIADIEKIADEENDVITAAEAEKLCRDVLGDEAEETGFPISYRCTGAVSADDELYYVMNIAWLVNGANWSYIGNCYVSSDGEKIYDGVAYSGKHEITELRWKKQG